MKRLEQLLLLGRARARAGRAVLPGASGLRPTRLILRLNDQGLRPGLVRATGEPLRTGAWHDAITAVVRWLGPLRVGFVGGEPASSERLDELVRFANRLECPTHLVTAGGVDLQRAELLVDRGLGAVTVQVAGLDEATHRAVTGTHLVDAMGALDAFREARARRQRPLGLYVAIPLVAQNLAAAGPVAGWARQAGADGVLASAPLGSEPPPGAAEALAALGRDNLTPAHLAAWLCGGRARLRGGLRLELIADGTLLVSSLVAPLGSVRAGGPQALWEAGVEPIEAARLHPRPWDEVEQVPERLLSRR